MSGHLRYVALGVLIGASLFAAAASAQVPNPNTLEQVIRQRAEQRERDQQAEEQARKQPVIKELTDDKARAYVGEVVHRILRQTELKEQEKVTYQILEWDIVNAFVTPDMKVYVTTGLLELVESDDELACVLGHELGHVAAKHLSGRSKQALLWQGLMALGMAFSRNSGTIMGSQLLGTLGMMHYGRGQELEADRYGVKFAQSAGYDPYAMIKFMQKMGEKDGKMDDPVTVFLSTHPPAPARVDQIRKILKAEGLVPSKVHKLSFNIRTDRSPVDFSKGIEGATTTTSTAANLLANGKLAGSEDLVPHWTGEPLGATTTLPGGGVALAGTFGALATLRSDPVPIAPDVSYLVRARYHAIHDADVRLIARFTDASGNPAGEVASTAHVRKGEDGVLGVDLGGAGRPVPAGATSVSAVVGVAPGADASAEFRDVRLEEAAAPVSASAGAMTGNLCPNPGFETPDPSGKLPLHWSVTKGKGELDRKVKGAGNASFKLTASTKKEWAAMRSDRVKIDRGYDYLLSGMLRSSLGNQRMSLGLEFYRADGTLITQQLVGANGVFPAAEFTKYHGISFAAGGHTQIPPDAAEVAVVGMSGYYSTDPCWFDDIALLRVQSTVRRH